MDKGGDQKAALVLAGAVARGAFEAGVVAQLARSGMRFNRFVGTSAGALNATILAVGAAVDSFPSAAERLEKLWKDQAHIFTFLRPTISRGGLSCTCALEALIVRSLEELVPSGFPTRSTIPTRLTLVTTDLRGVMYQGELTHEDEHVYTEADLVNPLMWPEIARVAAASAAFPGLFAPPTVPKGSSGRRVDGGVVNNTPISYAIDETNGPGSNRIVVVAAELGTPKEEAPFWAIPLFAWLLEIIINERIGRDLVVARKRNRKREELIQVLRDHGCYHAETTADALGFRWLDIVTVRPAGRLAGGLFGGFFCRRWRKEQIEDGKEAARTALGAR